jgi:hypothetical protein
MKRKESDRSQSIRMQSYSYLKDKVDREEWSNLRVHEMNSEESAVLCEQLYVNDV